LNIASCCIKTKDFVSAVEACNETLKLDSHNKKGLYRKARALSLPLNAGVEEFQEALGELKKSWEIDKEQKHVEREIKKLQRLITVNRKREHDTYGKMFTGKSVNDYVTQKLAKQTYKSGDEREYEEEKKKMDEKIKLMMD